MNRGDFNRILERAWNDWWPNHLGQPLWVDDIGDGSPPYLKADLPARARVTEAFAVAIEHALEAEKRGARGTDIDHRTFEAVMREADKVPPPPPSVLEPIRGYLAIRNGSFSDDLGARCVTMCHAGDLAMRSSYDWDGAMRALDGIQSAGYHGVRTWDRLRWGGRPGEKPGIHGDWGHETATGWGPQLRKFLDACQTRGLRVHLAAGDLAKLSTNGRMAYFQAREELTRLKGDLIVLNEWANESRDTAGGLTPQDAERDMAEMRALPNLVSLTAYTGHEDEALFREWTPSWLPFCQVHGFRGGHWWDKIRHIFSLPYEMKVRRLWWQGEPFGPGALVSATENKHELTAGVMALAAWQAVITGQVWTYFSSPGVVLGDERFEDQPGFAETPRMVAVADRLGREHGINWGQLRLIHGGPGRANLLEIASGGHDARIDQAIDDTKGICFATVYGPTGITARNKDPRYRWSWINPETAEVVEGVDVTRTLKPGGLVGIRQ